MAPLLDAADEAEWFGAIAGLAETWGFDRLLIAMLPRPTIRLEDAYVRSTYSPSGAVLMTSKDWFTSIRPSRIARRAPRR